MSSGLIGTVEFARRKGVSPATVRKWRERFASDSDLHPGAPRFPDAVAYDGNRPLYRASVLDAWYDAAESWLRPGRPSPETDASAVS